MQRSTVERVAAVATTTVEGTFLRHAAPGRKAFVGGDGGRWGATFPVIYLARPMDSCVLEAYRHLVEPFPGMRPELVPARVVYTVGVKAHKILDLTEAGHAAQVGLSAADLSSEVGDYVRCQEVAAAAHQLAFHGILAPAAAGTGQTLALFRERISAEEMPTVSDTDMWAGLPPDPRNTSNTSERPALKLHRGDRA